MLICHCPSAHAQFHMPHAHARVQMPICTCLPSRGSLHLLPLHMPPSRHVRVYAGHVRRMCGFDEFGLFLHCNYYKHVWRCFLLPATMVRSVLCRGGGGMCREGGRRGMCRGHVQWSMCRRACAESHMERGVCKLAPAGHTPNTLQTSNTSTGHEGPVNHTELIESAHARTCGFGSAHARTFKRCACQTASSSIQPPLHMPPLHMPPRSTRIAHMTPPRAPHMPHAHDPPKRARPH